MTAQISDIRDLLTKYYADRNSRLQKLLLDTFGINYFSYQRIDEVGNYLLYQNDLSYFNYYVDNSMHLSDDLLVTPHNFITGSSLHTFDYELKDWSLSLIPKLKEIQTLFNFNQSIMLKRNFQNYYEIYIFSISEKSRQSLDTLISLKEHLEKFIEYFHREYCDELKIMSKMNINIKELRGEKFNCNFPIIESVNNDHLSKFVETVDQRKFQLMKSIEQLTGRERDCLHWLIQGKSAQDTADILGISRRTVETFRENCRKKFGSNYTFSNLIYLLAHYGLV